MVGVGAIIIHDNRVVLVRRENPPLANEWSIPGGVLEVGELVCEGVVREALEETGLVVEAVDLLGVYDRVVRDEDGRIFYHFVLIDFLCRWVSGSLQAGSDAGEAQWVSSEGIRNFELHPETKEVISRGMQRAGLDTRKSPGTSCNGT